MRRRERARQTERERKGEREREAERKRKIDRQKIWSSTREMEMIKRAIRDKGQLSKRGEHDRGGSQTDNSAF